MSFSKEHKPKAVLLPAKLSNILVDTGNPRLSYRLVNSRQLPLQWTSSSQTNDLMLSLASWAEQEGGSAFQFSGPNGELIT